MRLRAVPLTILFGILRTLWSEDVWGDGTLSSGATGASDTAREPVGSSVVLPTSAALSSSVFGDAAFSGFFVRTPDWSVSGAAEGVASVNPFNGSYGADAGVRINAGYVGECSVIHAALFGDVRYWSTGSLNDPQELPDAYGPIGIVLPNSTLPSGSTGAELFLSFGGPTAAVTAIPRAALFYGESPGWIGQLSVRGDLGAGPLTVLSLAIDGQYEQRIARFDSWRTELTPGLTWYGPGGSVISSGITLALQSSTLLTELAQLGVTGSAATSFVSSNSFFEVGIPTDFERALARWVRIRLSCEPTLLARFYPAVVGGIAQAQEEWELIVPIAGELVLSTADSVEIHVIPAWTVHLSNSDYRRWESASISVSASWSF